MNKINLIIITILLSIIFYFLGKSISNQSYDTNQNQEKIIESTQKIINKKTLQSPIKYSQNQTAKIKSKDIFEEKKSKYEKNFYNRIQDVLNKNNSENVFYQNENSLELTELLGEETINIDNTNSIYFNIELFIKQILDGKENFEIFDVDNNILTLNISNFKIINDSTIIIYINNNKFHYDLNYNIFSLYFINNEIKNNIILKDNKGYIFTHLHKDLQE